MAEDWLFALERGDKAYADSVFKVEFLMFDDSICKYVDEEQLEECVLLLGEKSGNKVSRVHMSDDLSVYKLQEWQRWYDNLQKEDDQ